MSHEESQEAPIVTYLNRLQKQMFLITLMLSDRSIPFDSLARPIRMLIYNLPTNGQIALDGELQLLEEFERYIGKIRDRSEMEHIYQKVHNWAYINLFQDAFKIKTRIGSLDKIGDRLSRED